MKIYFAGSIRGGRDDKELYLEIIKRLSAMIAGNPRLTVKTYNNLGDLDKIFAEFLK